MTDQDRERLDGLRSKWRALEDRYRKTREKNDMPPEEREELRRLSRQERDEDREALGAELYDWTTQMFFEEDPIHLVKMGVPKNEYEIEARYILKELRAFPTPHMNDVHDVVWKIFNRMFGPVSGKREDYRQIAEKLYFKVA